MSFEDRLRDHLHDKGEAIIPPPTPVGDVERSGKRRTMGKRIGGSLAAVALVAGGVTLLNNQAGDERSDEVIAAEPAVTTTLEAEPAVDLEFREVDGPALGTNQNISTLFATDSGYVALVDEWQEPEPPDLSVLQDALPAEILDAFGGSLPTSVDQIFEVLEPAGLVDQAFQIIESDPALSMAVFPPGTSTTSIWTSPDGVSWEQQSVGADTGIMYANDVAEHDGTYYFLTNSYDEVGMSEVTKVVTTTDFETFAEKTLPNVDTADAEYLTQYTSAYQLAVGDDGVVVGGDSWTDIDVWALLPDEYADGSYSPSWTPDGIEIWRYPEFEGDPAFGFESSFPVPAVPDFGGGTVTFEATEESGIAVEEPAATEIVEDLPIPVEPDEFWDGELVTTIPWADLGVDPADVEQLFNGHNGGSAIWHAPLGGDFSITDGLSDSDEFHIVDLVATDDGFLAVGNGWSGNGNVARIWTSSNGTDWTINTAASASFGNADVFSGVDRIGDRLVIVGTCEGNAVSWVSTDGGTFWIMHMIEDQVGVDLGDNFGLDQTAAGDLGMVSVVTVWPEFDDDFGFEGFEEPVLIEKDGYAFTLDMLSGTGSLSGPDGIIHDGIELFQIDGVGGIDGVFTTNENDDITFLDPVTGDELVTFTAAEGEAAINAQIPDEVFDEALPPAEFAETPPRYILFSGDGAMWSATDATELGLTGEWWAQGVAVGTDNVLLAVQEFDEIDYLDAEAPIEDFGPTVRYFVGTPVS